MEATRKKPESLRLRAVMPTLTVSDIHASIAFYRDVLGFIVVDTIEREGELVGASVRAGTVDILLGQDDFARGRNRAKGVGSRLYCITHQDIDEIAAAIKQRGGRLDSEPQDQPWGTRDFAVTDPDGYKLSISSPMPH
jgi:uncharacterized glyoxalase superfamily protein PhnB